MKIPRDKILKFTQEIIDAMSKHEMPDLKGLKPDAKIEVVSVEKPKGEVEEESLKEGEPESEEMEEQKDPIKEKMEDALMHSEMGKEKEKEEEEDDGKPVTFRSLKEAFAKKRL